ncbi:Tripartite-type tricarboxylate transporter, receptor component TctC [Tistlia consotensis]|uniref:Tripartite-type tricarboxylate transporter, receptor component TctC n=1 Tax=Tistlia consotensis USBA 355 TaxID=560819 RepID=A0A1Y6BLL9_9PROT|nr:tripartite tricarboxylate transporter substrate binding protein [Tistlia consotensis]SMF13978.1 Tripartite-type tricarboxylate transporter, receptor component TctC [Tistlia consotensis USBA 355]SNR49999.1 Tripartite-type tricarboxylate transporter, receptor component TctC [Tistlia consotensis]
MLRRTLLSLAGAAAVLAATGLAAPAARAEWPERPITIIVPWGAGGGTDAVGRIIASLMEKDLGQPVNVVNRTGGSGVVGHSAIATADPDGYTLGVVTVEIAMMHWQGLTDLSYKDYAVLGQVNLDPGGLMVGEDSPYKSAKDLLAAIKAKPKGTFKASGTGQGGIWHLGLAGWMLSEGLPGDQVTWVPSQGSAPALKDMVAGGVDLVTSSLAEGRALIEAGKVRPLANMGTERLGIFPDVPTLKEATGSDWTVGAWRVIAGPKGIPDAIVQKASASLEKAYKSKEFQDFMKSRGFGTVWRGPKEATEFMASADKDLGEVMKKAGLVK